MQTIKISKLKGNPSNPRVLRDEKFIKLKNSIQAFPDMLQKRPIVAVTDKDGKYMVLGGNMRLKACADLGMKEVPVILADEWTEEQRREFIIKDNVGFGEWDWDQLANEWDAGQLSDWGLDVPKVADEADPFDDEGVSATDQFGVIVMCRDDVEQARVFEKLVADGHTCKVVVT
jgi:ParB-like chromosome segregation protein Spo0J